MSNTSKPLKRWTEDEVQLLTNNLDKILDETSDGALLGMSTPTIKELAELFERTEAAVHHKARIIAVKLGKISTTSPMIAKNAGVPVLEQPMLFPAQVEVDWMDAVLSKVYGKVDYTTFKEIQKQLNNGSHE